MNGIVVQVNIFRKIAFFLCLGKCLSIFAMDMQKSVYQTKDVQFTDDGVVILKDDLGFLQVNTSNGELCIEAMKKADKSDLKRIQTAFLASKDLKKYLTRRSVECNVQDMAGLQIINIFLKLIYRFNKASSGSDRAKEDMEYIILYLKNNFSELKDRQITYTIPHEQSEECKTSHTVKHGPECVSYYYTLHIWPDEKQQESKNKEVETESDSEKSHEPSNFVKREIELQFVEREIELQKDIVDFVSTYNMGKACAENSLLFIRGIEEADEDVLKRIQKDFVESDQLKMLIVKFLTGPVIMHSIDLWLLNRFLKKVYSFALPSLLTKDDAEASLECIIDCLNRKYNVSVMDNIRYSISQTEDKYWYQLNFDGYVDKSDNVIEQTSSDIDLINFLQSDDDSSEGDLFTIIFSFFYSLWCDLTYPLRWLFG